MNIKGAAFTVSEKSINTKFPSLYGVCYTNMAGTRIACPFYRVNFGSARSDLVA